MSVVYLVRDIKPPIHFHQTTNITKFCISRHLQDLEKVGWFQYKNQQNSAENKKCISILLKKFVDWWIGGLMSRTRYIVCSVVSRTKSKNKI